MRTGIPSGTPTLVEAELECPDADAPDIRRCSLASPLVLTCDTGEQAIVECFSG